MASDIAADSSIWLDVARNAIVKMRALYEAHPTTSDRSRTVGVGEGGDHTLVIDALCEDALFEELERLAADGATFAALSEERGTVSFGAEYPLVVIDPIDGSLNAKRCLPQCSLAFAVASGPTASDVEFGFVFDFGTEEEWHAFRGGGAQLNGVPLVAAPELLDGDGRLEVVGIESADPRWLAYSVESLAECVYRLRVVGSIAISMCQVAAGRFDGMLSLRSCRSVDAVAAGLILRESGGSVSFPAFERQLGMPLDLTARSPVVAARSEESVARLEATLTAQP